MVQRLLIILWIFTNNTHASDYIAINARALRLNKATKCTDLSTAKIQDICDCCLLKYTLVYKIDPDKALAACEAKKMCELKASSSSERAVSQAYNNLSPFKIVEIKNLPKAPLLPEDGILGENNILEILASLSRNAYLPDFMKRLLKRHAQTPCLKIQTLGNMAKGVHTGQLFSVSINELCLESPKPIKPRWRVIYILKESKKGYSELLNLYKVKVSELKEDYISTSRIIYAKNKYEKFPTARVTFEDVHFALETKDQTRYFSLLQAAKGKSIQDQLSDFGNKLLNTRFSNPDRILEINKAKNMFFRVGFALSKLHQKHSTKSFRKKQKLGKTYIHGDLHAQNIFYDHESGEVSLIDNETFSLALKKRTSGVNDIVDLYLLHTVKTVAHQFAKQLLTNQQMAISDILWHELWHELFLGYIRAYEFTNSQDLQDGYWEFRSKFYEGLSNAQLFDSIKNFKDQRVLKRFGPSFRRFYIKEHYLDQVFIALQKSLKIENLL